MCGSEHRRALDAPATTIAAVALALLLLSAVVPASAQSVRVGRGVGGNPPRELRCEYLKDPIGLDVARPRFSWIGSDPDRGAAQRAYRVLVASSEERLAADDGDLWDSGRVLSSRSVLVPYEGAPLRSKSAAYFKVETWNRAFEPSGFSEVARFETAYLPPDEWRAPWIGPAEGAMAGRAIPWGDWIAAATPSPPGDTLYFRTVIDVDDTASIEHAGLKVVADDAFALFVNGDLLATATDVRPRVVDIRPSLVAGRNSIAIRVLNVDGVLGLMAGGRLDRTDGVRVEFGTGEAALGNPLSSWKVSRAAPAGWVTPGFDDSAWESATSLGPRVIQPWGLLEDDRGNRRSMCLRRDFTIDKPVKRARLFATGLGCYEVSINGRRVSNDILAPGWTYYPKRIQYQTYDVTEVVREGANAIGAILGNGWWSGGVGWLFRFRYSDGSLRFSAELLVEHEDGSFKSVLTDKAWTTHESPVVRDGLYDGEAHDARLEIAGWDEPGLDETDWAAAAEIEWPAGRLVAQRYEPVRPTAELPVRSTSLSPAGATILDFGQNATGRVRLRVEGPRGTVVAMRFAEALDADGSLDVENLRTAQATDRYVLKGGGVETWEPRFTYHGFRFVEESGVPGGVDPADFTAVVFHTDAPRTGAFRCSDPLLNRIHQLVTWSHRSNLFNMITDCPQRDERMGWTGDAVVSSPTFVYNLGVAPVLSKWMRDMSDNQTKDGAVNDVSPACVQWGPAAPGWGDAMVRVPWTLYVQYGDARVLEENYEGMKAWVEYMRAHSTGDLYEREGYGDWLSLEPTPKGPIGSAFYYDSTRLLSRAAAVIGRGADAREYSDLADRIRDAFNAAHFDEDGATYGESQTANVLPLAFGMVPPEHEAGVVGTLADDIARRGNHLTTGFLGTAFVPFALAPGRNDVYHAVATRRDFPGWGYMISLGATTLWEHWDADRYPPYPSSLNHPSLSSIDRWFYEEIAGVKPVATAPGFARTELRPYLPPGMESASAELDTVHGRVASRWTREPGGAIDYEVLLPPNTSGEVWVPLAVAAAEDAVVSEGGLTLLAEGKAATARFGIRFLRLEPGYAVFDVLAGTFLFRSE